MGCAVLCQEGGPGGAQADDAARVRTSRPVASGGPHGPSLFCRVVMARPARKLGRKGAGENVGAPCRGGAPWPAAFFGQGLGAMHRAEKEGKRGQVWHGHMRQRSWAFWLAHDDEIPRAPVAAV